MSLVELWKSSRAEIEAKRVDQLIAIAGEGQLRDGSQASSEFRDLLFNVPSALLERFIEDCLEGSFKESGLALQDIVNQVGRRLGFSVKDGRYRGTPNFPGYDGIWKSTEDHSIIIEVKTTDTYRIDLNTIAGYRRALQESNEVDQKDSSMLIVVGRQDTGDLEAQIRGSRHAWDIRLISIDSLIRLMRLKEKLEDPQTISRIHEILIPREFTRLDEIVAIAFSAAEDVTPEPPDEPEEKKRGEKQTHVSFNDACAARIEKQLGTTLVKQSRGTYTSPDGKLGLLCSVSKTYERSGHEHYWFAFHKYSKEALEARETAFVSFGCGSENLLLLIPLSDFVPLISEMNATNAPPRFYWHVFIHASKGKMTLRRKKGAPLIDLTRYLVK
jgi:hypothetical protein